MENANLSLNKGGGYNVFCLKISIIYLEDIKRPVFILDIVHLTHCEH